MLTQDRFSAEEMYDLLHKDFAVHHRAGSVFPSTDFPMASDSALIEAHMGMVRFMRACKEPEVSGFTFVDANGLPVQGQAWGTRWIASPLAQEFFPKLASFMRCRQVRLTGCPAVELFHDITFELLGNADIPAAPELTTWAGHRNLSGAEIFNEIVLRIRNQLSLPHYHDKYNARKQQVQRNIDTVLELLKTAFSKKDEVSQIVKIELGFQFGMPGALQMVVARECIETFLTKVAKKTGVALRGYLRKFEYAPQRGLYFHVVLVLVDSAAAASPLLMGQLQAFWGEITLGTGIAMDCRHHPNPVKQACVGRISHGDKQACLLLRRSLTSLCLMGHYLRLRDEDSRVRVIVGGGPSKAGTAKMVPRNEDEPGAPLKRQQRRPPHCIQDSTGMTSNLYMTSSPYQGSSINGSGLSGQMSPPVNQVLSTSFDRPRIGWSEGQGMRAAQSGLGDGMSYQMSNYEPFCNYR